ncbi:hypothetical protein GGF32_002119 [Allomyces javanicus]|nr:hypothetical protein GGF32_002119 [Allomyces javanicus]
MAAKGRTGVLTDNSVEAWNLMRENTHQSWKFTGRTLRIGAVLLVAVPYTLYQAACYGQKRWDQRYPPKAE